MILYNDTTFSHGKSYAKMKKLFFLPQGVRAVAGKSAARRAGVRGQGSGVRSLVGEFRNVANVKVLPIPMLPMGD